MIFDQEKSDKTQEITEKSEEFSFFLPLSFFDLKKITAD